MIKKLFLSIFSLFLYSCSSEPTITKVLCGGLPNYTCPTSMFCMYEKNCGGVDKEGICIYKPMSCPNTTDEICGCDDKTYLNSCIAAVRGISVKSHGPCVTTEKGR